MSALIGGYSPCGAFSQEELLRSSRARLFDVVCDLLHGRKPYVAFGRDVRDQPIELHDPRSASADVRMLREDEHRPFLKGEIELGLVDLEHRIRRRERPVRGFAVIHVVVTNLADREFDHTARLPVREDLVGYVCGEQTAVVEEAGLADQIERLRTESRAWRADPYGTLPGRLRQILDGFGEQPLLLRRVSDTR